METAQVPGGPFAFHWPSGFAESLSPITEELSQNLIEEAVLIGSGLPEDPLAGEAALERRPVTVLYSVLCPPAFAEAVNALAERRDNTLSGLVDGVLALVHPGLRAMVADPGSGGAEAGSISESSSSEEGPSPPPAVLSLSLRPGLAHGTIRQALAVALALDDPLGWSLRRQEENAELRARVEKLEYRTGQLVQALEKISFEPREEGIASLAEAAAVFGFRGHQAVDEQMITRRFRQLAPIYHPDTGMLPCRRRMALLIEARKFLLSHVRRTYGGWRVER
jgi:hypothetical protein